MASRTPDRSGLLVLTGVLALGAALAACSPTSPPGTAQTVQITLPSMEAEGPMEMPGLHNLVAYAPGVLSGSAPEGDAGFASLRALGIRTIISVDGASPDLRRAQSAGLRYVHLPIGYDGMSREHAMRIARAVRDLPGPVYVHCHHGKHRSACAAGAAVVLLGLAEPERALQRMKVSGTSPSYPGLFRVVQNAEAASPAQLDAASSDFPSTWTTSSFVQAMVEIDDAMEHLKHIRTAGWATPQDHPDLVPAAEAGRMADAFRVLALGKQRPELAGPLTRAGELASRLEAALQSRPVDPQPLEGVWTALSVSCTDCHRAHRD